VNKPNNFNVKYLKIPKSIAGRTKCRHGPHVARGRVFQIPVLDNRRCVTILVQSNAETDRLKARSWLGFKNPVNLRHISVTSREYMACAKTRPN